MTKKTRILITGATGLLGRALMKVFTEPSLEHFELMGLGWSRYDKYSNQYPNEMKKLDITNDSELTELITTFKPDIIIHAAAERRPDVCDKDKEAVQKLNVDTTKKLVNLSKMIGSCLFYISSDYVFDGTSPPYDIDSTTNPLSFYGQTKLDSELIIKQAAAATPEHPFKFIILRVPVLYGLVESLKECAVTVVAEQVIAARDSGKPVEIDNWQLRFPTCVDDVARVSLQLILCREYGVFHFSSTVMKTKYDIAMDMAKVLSIDNASSLILPMNQQPSGAPRPHNAQLNIIHTVDTIKKKLQAPIHLSILESQLILIFKDLNLIN